ncbi:MAG: hypothetical protein NVS4B11_19620 [Ktedonobacteraceae bacterium]
MLKKLTLLDMLVVLVMSFLLYYGASWQIFIWFTDAGKYECYAVAFWHGVSALKALPVPEIQCHFITHPLPETVFITTDTLVQILRMHNFPQWLIAFVAAQSPTQPLHSLPHEYPLLTVLPFTLGLVTSAHWYQVAFAVVMAVLAGVVYFVLKTWKSRQAAIAFAIYTVVGCWATAVARYDIIPTGFALGALLLAERRRWRWAFVMLALATMFKFYPIVLVPAFFIAQQKSQYRSWRKWWKGLDVFVLVCAAITTFSLLLSVEGTLAPLGYFGNRPIQAESSAASILWIASFFGFPLHYAATYGSLNMLSPLSGIVSLMMTLLLIVGLAYVIWLQWRGKIPLAVSLLLTLLIVICTGKVFSPQYLLWVIPFVAYIGECNWRWLLSWTGIGLLTTWIFPYIYAATTVFLKVPTIPTFHPAVFARNISLVTFLVVLLYHYTVHRKKVVLSIPIPQHSERETVASMAQLD